MSSEKEKQITRDREKGGDRLPQHFTLHKRHLS